MATTCIFHMYMSRSFSDTLSRLRANMSLLLHFSDVYLAWKPLNNVVPFFLPNSQTAAHDVITVNITLIVGPTD